MIESYLKALRNQSASNGTKLNDMMPNNKQTSNPLIEQTF